MTLELTAISARRAYEYGIDSIRLSVICTEAVQANLIEAFKFKSAEVAIPQSTFGETQLTTPPGLVLQVGEANARDGQVVPIRALMFDSVRIVIDIAAPSEFIDEIAARVFEVLSGHTAPDGRSLLGEPIAVRDQSDLVFELRLPVTLGVADPVWRVIARHIPSGYAPAVTLLIRASVTGIFGGAGEAFVLEPRGGSRIGANSWFSSAPLPSAAHGSYVKELVAAVSGRARARRRVQQA